MAETYKSLVEIKSMPYFARLLHANAFSITVFLSLFLIFHGWTGNGLGVFFLLALTVACAFGAKRAKYYITEMKVNGSILSIRYRIKNQERQLSTDIRKVAIKKIALKSKYTGYYALSVNLPTDKFIQFKIGAWTSELIDLVDHQFIESTI